MLQQFNVKEAIADRIKHVKETFLTQFQGSVGDEVAKVKISHKLELKPHTFAGGEKGHVCKKLDLVIDFGDAVIQPHNAFEDCMCSAVIEQLADEVNGQFENADD